MSWLYILLACAGGIVLPVQALINARLGVHLGGTIMAALVSFQVGAVALLMLQIAFRCSWSSAAAWSGAPAWAYLGGFLGVLYMLMVIFAVPRLGAGTTSALIIFGQVAASLLLDQFGILSRAAHAASPLRLLGALLLVGGAALVTLF